MTIVSDYLPASTLHKRADDCPAGQTNILVTYLYNGVSWTTALELVYSERKITIYANNLFAKDPVQASVVCRVANSRRQTKMFR